MAGGTTTLLFEFLSLDSQASASFDRMGAKTEALGATSSKALAAMRGLGIGVAVAGATVVVAGVDMAAKFQTSMLRIQTQANGSRALVGKLSKGILEMAGSVSTTPAILADAAYHIASVGQKSLSAAQQLSVLKLAAEGAKVGGADLTDTTNALTAAVVSGIKGAGNFSKAMGILNATVGAGDMKMQDLADALGTGVTITAKQAGVSLGQMGAALAVFGDNNVRGAKAGTQLRMTIQALEHPASTGAAAMASLGLSTSKLATDMQQGGLPKAIADLRTHMIAAGDTGSKIGATLTDAFGKRAGSGIATLVGEYSRFQNKLKETQQGGNNFASSWKTYSKSFGAALDGAKASGEALLITLGTRLLPTATKLMNWLRSTGIPDLQALVGWFERNKVAAAALGLGVLAMIDPFVALGAALVIGYEKFKSFHDGVNAVLANLKSTFGSTWSSIESSVKQFLGGALSWARSEMASFKSWWSANGAAIKEAAGRVWTAISDVIKVAIKVWLDVAKVELPILKGYISDGFAVIRDVVAAIADIIDGKWGAALSNLWKATKSGLAMVLVPWTAGWHLIERAFGDVAGAVIQGLEWLTSSALSFLSTFVHAASSSFGWVPVIGGHLKNAAQNFDDFKSNTVATLQDLANKAYGLGSKTGVNLDLGLTAGLLSEKRGVVSMANEVANAAVIAMHHAAGVKSPSYKAYYIGKMLAEGLINGWKDGTSSLRDLFSQPIQNVLDHLQSQMANALSQQEQRLKTAQQTLKSVEQARKSAISSAASGLAGNAGIAGVFGTDPTTGLQTMANVNTFQGGQVGPLKKFAHDLKWAQAHHLNPVDLAQIVAMGAAQGDQVLQQYMSGAASIAVSNKDQRLIDRYSSAAASTGESGLYAKRIAKAEKEDEKQTELLKEVRDGIKHLADKVEHAAQHGGNVTIKLPTGGEIKVTDALGHEIIKVLKKLERTSGTKLI